MIVGWDLGGAHVKRAQIDASGHIAGIAQVPCTLWQGLDRLEDAIRELHRAETAGARHAVTMTGELVDLFEHRATGVRSILETFERLTQPGSVQVFSAHGFVATDRACEQWDEVASMNWLASAQWVARHLAEAIVVDVGSTTTDLFLIGDGRVQPVAYDDRGRLASEELVYTGVVRTPLMAIATQVPFRGEWTAVMAEHFATTGDLYRIGGELDPASDQAATADGRDKSRTASMRRIARMLGTDMEQATPQSWARLSRWWADAQLARIGRALDRQLSRDVVSGSAPIVGLGAGAFLAARLAQARERRYVDFADLTGAPVALREAARTCGPALAAALLLHHVPRAA